MALVIDSEMPAAAGAIASGASSLSYSFTNTAGTFLQILTTGALGVGTDTITSMKYNGVEADAKQLNRATIDGLAYQGIGTLANPATGANTVLITFSAVMVKFSSGCISYTGQHATTPVGNTATASGFSGGAHTLNLSSAAGNIVTGLYGDGCGINTLLGTQSWQIADDCGGHLHSGACDRQNGAATVTTGFTDVGADNWMITAQEIVAAPGIVAAPAGAMLQSQICL